MESKKASMFASLMEDDSDGPGAASFRPLSPFRDDGSMRSRTGTAVLSLNPPQQDMSCVTRETFQEDCARHRFIVWAAVKRNSNSRMKPEEKLVCPLLRCERRFPDHESMLRHLAGCSWLPSGEYWCYDHMRVERFDDLKCKRCIGHPSKRKKMLSIAKNFFHSLGHKSKKTHGPADASDGDSILPPPPYDSLDIGPSDVSHLTELSSDEIVEIDSVEVHHPPVTGLDGVIDPQALLVPVTPHLPELDSVLAPADPFAQWQPSPGMPTPSFPIYAEDCEVRSPNAKPTLQLTTQGLPARRYAVPRPAPAPTRSKGLSPSSSVRSTASTDTTASTSSNVSSLVSPSSNWSGVWSTSMPSGGNTSLTSPVEGFNPFADVQLDPSCTDYLHTFFSELPADIPVSKAEDPIATDPLIQFDAPQQLGVWNADLMLTDDDAVNMVNVGEAQVEDDSGCCSETKSVVGSAWDALQEHLVSSTLKIQHVKGNHLADQLKPMSTRTIATGGLRLLRTLLDGGQPSSAVDTLCFVHLMYAFSLAVHEKGTSQKSKQFFLQSLAYANALPLSDRKAYRELTFIIWQPPDVDQADIMNCYKLAPGQTPSRSSSLKGKEPAGARVHVADSLLGAARDFLDELEMSLVMGSMPPSLEVTSSELYAKHLGAHNSSSRVNQAFVATVSYVLSVLDGDYDDVVALKDKLVGVRQRANAGSISSVRRVEIEMLHAGKECIPTMRFFDNFTPDVRSLCDQIHEQHDARSSRRNAYHQAGISLIERLIPELDRSTGEPLTDEHDDLDEFFDNLSAGITGGNMDLGFSLDLVGSSETTRMLPIPTLITTPAATPLSHSANIEQNEGQKNEKPDQGQKVEADTECELCGYRPKGDPQWFKGSMAKHKKLQHSTAPPKIYKCPYPGCSSQYKNRPDNLRQHQIEKNHWVKGDEVTPRRPSKRKKVDTDE
ncbi:hypothetical protein OQA88_12914 [Cercophora sp. LCS_1]